jgi:predicted TIM-barrel fold metal-dependent hydrolase
MDAPAAQLAAMLARLGVSRTVLVQPSFYGTDNACMLDAMLHLEDVRGVAVLPPQVASMELKELHARGIRGLRVNIAAGGQIAIEAMRADIEAAAATCARNGWHVQIFVPSAAIEPLSPILLGLPVDIVIDHFGMVGPGQATGALHALLRLLESGKVWVKISGAYRIAGDPFDAAIGPLARRLYEANPERMVWGSDWPHTPRHEAPRKADVEVPFQDIDTIGLLALVPHWLGDEKRAARVLVTNPARLYDFEDPLFG